MNEGVLGALSALDEAAELDVVGVAAGGVPVEQAAAAAVAATPARKARLGTGRDSFTRASKQIGPGADDAATGEPELPSE
jgi:hypothetical protein